MTLRIIPLPAPWRIVPCKGGGWRRHIRAETANPNYDIAVTDEQHADLIAAAPKLLRIAEMIELAYREGPSDTFHTRLSVLAGGNFANVLIDALSQARGGV